MSMNIFQRIPAFKMTAAPQHPRLTLGPHSESDLSIAHRIGKVAVMIRIPNVLESSLLRQKPALTNQNSTLLCTVTWTVFEEGISPLRS